MAKKTKPKTYKNLKALVAAFKSGELTKKTPLNLDNDCSHLYVYADDEDADGVCVFDGGGPEELLWEALDLLGVPHEAV